MGNPGQGLSRSERDALTIVIHELVLQARFESYHENANRAAEILDTTDHLFNILRGHTEVNCIREEIQSGAHRHGLPYLMQHFEEGMSN